MGRGCQCMRWAGLVGLETGLTGNDLKMFLLWYSVHGSSISVAVPPRNVGDKNSHGHAKYNH